MPADGERFIMIADLDADTEAPPSFELHVVLNFSEELKRRAPVAVQQRIEPLYPRQLQRGIELVEPAGVVRQRSEQRGELIVVDRQRIELAVSGVDLQVDRNDIGTDPCRQFCPVNAE